jgi:DNA-binding CsgD family transcriptional regulator
MNGDDDALEPMRVRLIVTALLAVVAVGGATDLYFDAPRSWLSAHVLIEATLMTVSAAGALFLWRGWHHAAAGLAGARVSIAARETERDAWRRRAESALDGLGQAIDDQFSAWGLTPAEREIALLLLKGHGHKQIAARLQRSERTVRQHAVAVYEKSGLAGRAELAAFFLEGLMLPRGAPRA